LHKTRVKHAVTLFGQRFSAAQESYTLACALQDFTTDFTRLYKLLDRAQTSAKQIESTIAKDITQQAIEIEHSRGS
jgi:hypothetical protein